MNRRITAVVPYTGTGGLDTLLSDNASRVALILCAETTFVRYFLDQLEVSGTGGLLVFAGGEPFIATKEMFGTSITKPLRALTTPGTRGTVVEISESL